MALSLTKDPT